MNIRPFNGLLPILGNRVYIDPQACVIGQVVLGDDVAIYPMAVLRGDMHHITIGDRTNIQDGCVLHITHPSDKTHPDGYALNIGADVTVGHGVILHGCTIEGLSLIGMRSIIMDGAVVSKQVIIGAGSLVPPGKVLESGFLYMGTPVVKKRPLTAAELSFIPYSAENYRKLKDQYLAEC